MHKGNSLIFCLISCVFQSFSWSCSKDDMDKLCKNFRNFTEVVHNNENRDLAIFENPHAEEELPTVSYIDTPNNSINTINHNNDIRWQNLVLARFKGHLFTSHTSVRTLTLARYFYNLCRIERFSCSPFPVLFGKMNQKLQYVTEKSLFVKIESYNAAIRNCPFEQYQPDRNYKLVVVPYDVQRDFFSVSEHKEPDPELTWNNIERYIKEGRYKEECGRKYLLGLFKYGENFVFLRFKIYVP